MTITIIRAGGDVETHDIPYTPTVVGTIADLIGAMNLDTINLRDGRVMLVDDDGYDVELVDHGPGYGPDGQYFGFRMERRCVRAKKPINATATALYHAVCVPGVTHQIVGDVAIVSDKDFE